MKALRSLEEILSLWLQFFLKKSSCQGQDDSVTVEEEEEVVEIGEEGSARP